MHGDNYIDLWHSIFQTTSTRVDQLLREINSVPDEGTEYDYMFEPEVDRDDIAVVNEGASVFLKEKRKSQKEAKSYKNLYYQRIKLPVYGQRQKILSALHEKQASLLWHHCQGTCTDSVLIYRWS